MVAPTTFHPFPKLPMEVRQKVWDEAANVRRLVKILVSEVDHTDQHFLFYKSAIPVPALLHVNQESRLRGLKFYKLAFGCSYDPIHKGLNTIYINFTHDIVYFPTRRSIDDGKVIASGKTTHHSLLHLRFFHGSNRKLKTCKKIVNLALDIGYAHPSVKIYSATNLLSLPNLKKLILIDPENETSQPDSDEESDDSTSTSPAKPRSKILLEDPQAHDFQRMSEAAMDMEHAFSVAARGQLFKKGPQPTLSLKVFSAKPEREDWRYRRGLAWLL